MYGYLKNEFQKIAKIKNYQQLSQSNCSAACLKTVLAHFNFKITEEQAAKLIGVREGIGAEVDEITEAAKKLGFNAFDRSLTIDECKKYLDKDIPIIADVQSFNYKGREHYVVIYKYENDNWYIMDPNTKGNQRILNTKELEERWWGRRMSDGTIIKKWGCIVSL